MTITIPRSVSRFTDLNLLFTKHPVSKDVTIRSDVEAIKFSIRNIILTKHYEKPFHPEFGSRIMSMLFENFTPGMVNMIRRDVELAIKQNEPRAILLGVELIDRSEMNEIAVSITFTTQNITDPVTFDVIVERTR